VEGTTGVDGRGPPAGCLVMDCAYASVVKFSFGEFEYHQVPSFSCPLTDVLRDSQAPGSGT